jgi:hypothetical protein
MPGAVVKRKVAKKPTKKPAAKKTAAGPSKYQQHMAKELKKLKAKYGYKVGATNNKKAWSEIFQEAVGNWKG